MRDCKLQVFWHEKMNQIQAQFDKFTAMWKKQTNLKNDEWSQHSIFCHIENIFYSVHSP